MQSAPQTPGQVEAFFSAWQTYRKVITHNYMQHRQMSAAVRDVVEATFGGGPIDVLDLGCGDATISTHALCGLPVTRFVGMDLSAAALSLARGHVQSRLAGAAVSLVRADYARALQATSGPFKLIVNSYSLHHLSAAQKQNYFNQTARLLDPEQGIHVLVDTVRGPFESRGQYVRRLANHAQTFVALSATERQGLIQHMLTDDWPETATALDDMSVRAGLTPHKVCVRDTFYAMLVSSRSPMSLPARTH